MASEIMLPSPCGDKLKLITDEVLDAVIELPSPCGDKLKLYIAHSKADTMELPSPCGDKLKPIKLKRERKNKSYRPLAGIN